MKILHPTDFSAPSLQALEQASTLAERSGGSLSVCHVHEPPDELPLGYLSVPVSRVVPTSQEVDFHYRMQATGRQRQRNAKEQVQRRLRSIYPNAQRHDLLFGDVVEQIKRFSAQHDLCVMAWGDTTRRLLQQAPIPVLCLPPETPTASIKRVLVGVDFEAPSLAALEWCGRLQRFGVELVLLHVSSGGDRGELERRLEELGPADARRFVETGKPSEALATAAADLGADAVAIGGKGRPPLLEALFRATGRSLLSQGTWPVLVVPQRSR